MFAILQCHRQQLIFLSKIRSNFHVLQITGSCKSCGRYIPQTKHYHPADSKQRHTSNSCSRLLLLGIVSVVCTLSWIMYKAIQCKQSQHEDLIIHQDKRCSGKSGTMMKVGRFWLPFEFFADKNKVKAIKKFNVRDDDIIIASFPKSGTTWVQEIVHQIITDLAGSETCTIEDLFPYIEYVYPGLKSLAQLSSPRYMKTHLPYELLPEGVQSGQGKVIYIARNVKDVSVSYYHFIKMLTITKYSGDFNDFFESFIEGKVAYGPWSEHVLQYWKRRNDENLLFITYEDLQKSPISAIRCIASFLGRSLDDKKVLEIAYKCSFNQMKSNPLVNYSWWDDLGIRDKNEASFMRKGKVGDWKNYYTRDMEQKMNESCIDVVEKEGLYMKDHL